MKTIICGSRDIYDYDIVKSAIEESGFSITEVVSGDARGVDRLGDRWGRENGVAVTVMPADWDRYGKRAGFERNKQMVEYVAPDGGVIAVWDGVSKGTKSTIDLAKRYGLKLFIKMV